MNSIDILKYPQFPMSSETLDFMQQMMLMVTKLTNLGGVNYILSGCEEIGNNVNLGFVVINGEILPFAGGTKATYVVIVETKDSVQVFGEVYSELYTNRIVTFGTGAGQLAWSDFKRVPNLLALDANKADKADLSPVGSVVIWSGTIANVPAKWKICDGSQLNVADYPTLFGVIGNAYGGNTSSFNLPNLSGRTVFGYKSSETEFDTIGKTGGEKTHTLTVEEIPSHAHQIQMVGSQPVVVGGDVFYAPNSSGSDYTDTIGGGQAHNNLPPYISMIYIIKSE